MALFMHSEGQSLMRSQGVLVLAHKHRSNSNQSHKNNDKHARNTGGDAEWWWSW